MLDECGHLLREYPDLAAFEWAIRAEHLVVYEGRDDDDENADLRFESIRRIIVDIIDDAARRGDLGPEADPRAAVDAVYALYHGLTELAATLPPDEFQAALSAAKVLVRGTLFSTSEGADRLIRSSD